MSTSNTKKVYSKHIQFGNDVVFVSGQLGKENGSGTLSGDFPKEARFALENLASALLEGGSDTSHMCMLTVYLTDMSDYQTFNTIYRAFLKSMAVEDPPARACFAVQRLPLGGLVEIECTAVKRGAPRKVFKSKEHDLPFSEAVVAGELGICWTSGQIGSSADADAKAQSKAALTNLKDVLSRAGASPLTTMKITVYLADIGDYAQMNEAYKGVFMDKAHPPPARAAFAVKSLPLGMRMEVCAIASTNPKASLRTVSGASAVPVYSPAVILSGSAVFCSGQIALDPSAGTKTLVGAGDIVRETTQALLNMQTVLTKAGSDMSCVRKVNIFISDMKNYAKVNDVYRTFFDGENPPARACVEVRDLPLGAMIEIECKAEKWRDESKTFARTIFVAVTAIALGLAVGIARRR